MRRLVAIGLISTMSLSPCPAFATARTTAARASKSPGKSADASLSGTAKTSTGQPLANATEQLRDLTTGQLVGSTTSSPTGAFSFTGIPAGNYEIELLNASGQIVGTSSSISVTAGATITGVAVAAAPVAADRAAGAAAGAGSAGATGGINRALLVTAVAAGAGIAGVIAVKKSTSSNSR